MQSELAQAEEDLNDTLNEHLLDISQDALNDLQDMLQEAFDDEWEQIFQDLDSLIDIMSAANDLTESSADAIVSTMNELLKFYGIDPITTGISAYYASGTKRVGHKVTAMTNEAGREMIVTKDGILTQLQPNDGVIPNDATENLMRMAEGDFSNAVMPNIQMAKFTMPASAANNLGGDIHIDSLVNVEGNADADTVRDIEEIANQLINNRRFRDEFFQQNRSQWYRAYQNAGGKRYV